VERRDACEGEEGKVDQSTGENLSLAWKVKRLKKVIDILMILDSNDELA
jgi:hypothetical protein